MTLPSVAQFEGFSIRLLARETLSLVTTGLFSLGNVPKIPAPSKYSTGVAVLSYLSLEFVEVQPFPTVSGSFATAGYVLFDNWSPDRPFYSGEVIPPRDASAPIVVPIQTEYVVLVTQLADATEFTVSFWGWTI